VQGDGLSEAGHSAQLLAALAVVLLTVLEGAARVARREAYDLRAALTSLFLAVGRRMVDRAPLWLTLPLSGWFFEHRVLELPSDAWWTWPLLLLSLELGHYTSHRAAHRVRWLWASHAVHHSSAELNLAAAFRLGWTGRLTFTIAFFSPLALLGFRPERILAVYTITLLYQVWLHAAWVPALGPLEGIFNTPSAHRVHHANAAAYRDKNFGGMLVVFDRLFGTYAAEQPDLATTYGWASPEDARRPFFVLLQPYRELAAQLARARTLRALGRALFGPPGTV
jgi:sterol desaturase/sphingolipid hydroxylase (fatty acid hydroxylase superfamily)